MVAWFPTTYAIGAYLHCCCEFVYSENNTIHMIIWPLLCRSLKLKISCRIKKIPHRITSTKIFLNIWFLHRHLCLFCYLCLFTCSGVQHIWCCVFGLFFFVLCILCCHFSRIVHFELLLLYSLTIICQSALFHYIQLPSDLQQVGLIFLRRVYQIFPVSLYFPILIAPAVFSNLLIRHLVIEVPSQESELTYKYESFMLIRYALQMQMI